MYKACKRTARVEERTLRQQHKTIKITLVLGCLASSLDSKDRACTQSHNALGMRVGEAQRLHLQRLIYALRRHVVPAFFSGARRFITQNVVGIRLEYNKN